MQLFLYSIFCLTAKFILYYLSFKQFLYCINLSFTQFLYCITCLLSSFYTVLTCLLRSFYTVLLVFQLILYCIY